MKIAIVAGGTGGHIYPGIAIAQEIKRRDPQAPILFLGSSEGLEKDIIVKEGYGLKLIKARALLRKVCYKAFSAPFLCAIGFFQSLRILSDFSPAVLVSTGGYVSLPVTVAARVLGIPILLHEQNVLPGAVNRLCKTFATKIFLTFKESQQYLKGEVVGNPVRREISKASREISRKKLSLAIDKKVILVMGGSQGAKKINEILISSLSKVPAEVEILHIVGNRDFAWVSRYLEGKQIVNYHSLPYLYGEMADALAAADLVVGRAGATAIAEFLIRGLPMVLVPFPYAAENHQALNAEAVAQSGAAIVIQEDNFSPEKLIEIITNPVLDYDKMGNASRKLAQPLAAERIVNYIYA